MIRGIADRDVHHPLQLSPFQGDAIVTPAMITKRQLGLILIAIGAMAALGLLLLDFLGAGQFQGIGPAQQRALVAAALVILVGLTLVPLGNRPA